MDCLPCSIEELSRGLLNLQTGQHRIIGDQNIRAVKEFPRSSATSDIAFLEISKSGIVYCTFTAQLRKCPEINGAGEGNRITIYSSVWCRLMPFAALSCQRLFRE